MTLTVQLSILWLVAVTIAGDIFLKQASSQLRMFVNVPFVFGTLLYAFGAFGWTIAFRHLKMGIVGGLYSSLTLVILAVIGYFIYGERLSGREILGIVLALCSIALFIGKE
jgi:drug/metabolite transporter (DMT)-like permease